MIQTQPRLLVILNTNKSPCKTCGFISPFMTASPLDPPLANAHAPVAPEYIHIPVVVERPEDAPSGWDYAPLDEYPSIGERVHNLSQRLSEHTPS